MLFEEARVMSECRTQEWFIQFRSGNLDVKDGSRFGRPVTGRVGEMTQMVDHKPACTLSTDSEGTKCQAHDMQSSQKSKLLKEA